MQAKDKVILILSGTCLVLLFCSISCFIKWRTAIAVQNTEKTTTDKLLIARGQEYEAKVDSIHKTYDDKIVALRDSFNNVQIASVPLPPNTNHGVSGSSTKIASVLTDYFRATAK